MIIEINKDTGYFKSSIHYKQDSCIMSGDCVVTALANYLLLMKFDIDIIEKLIFDIYTSDKYSKELGGMLVSDIPIIIKDKLALFQANPRDFSRGIQP